MSIVLTQQQRQAWEKWLRRIEECKSLEEGWDGYGAPAPNAVAIDNTCVFLKVLQDQAYEPTRVAASAMGGLAVTRKVGEKKAFVEFYNDGRVYGLFSDRTSGGMDVKPLAMDAESLRNFVALMREFLDG